MEKKIDFNETHGQMDNIVCKFCDSQMYLDDKDIDFDGKYDNYFVCPSCQATCVQEVRYHKPVLERWRLEVNGIYLAFSVKL